MCRRGSPIRGILSVSLDFTRWPLIVEQKPTTKTAWVQGPPDLWRHGSVGWPATHVDAADVAVWPYSLGCW